jgi:hypothetical protein
MKLAFQSARKYCRPNDTRTRTQIGEKAVKQAARSLRRDGGALRERLAPHRKTTLPHVATGLNPDVA